MKKFLMVFVLLFSFATLSASFRAPKKMWLGDALLYCKNNRMHLATINELKRWGGSEDLFWAYETYVVKPSSGDVFEDRNSFHGYYVLCEPGVWD